VTSNQKPISAIEFQHTSGSVKQAIHIDDENICDACRVAEKKSLIDWDARDAELRELCDKHRSSDGSYDCLVPGSGGKDSFVAAHMLKYKYGMHPLTVTWAPHVYTEWGWRNFQRWIHAGFDNYLCTPNGRVHRLLTRLAVENLFHPFQAFILGQKSLAPKMAVLHQIPLVFYGENEAEYGNPIGDADSAKRSWKYFSAPEKSSIHLGGTSIKDLTTDFGLEDVDLDPYLPANPAGLEKLGIEVHYLGYYVKWHPQSCYYYSVEHGGFEASPERTPGTYSKYNSIDDRIEEASLDYKEFQFLFAEGDKLVFMNSETYEQIELAADFVGERAAFLQDGMTVTLRLYEERPISVRLPDQVVLLITEADPSLKGQTAASSYKPARLENGLRVMVPPFIEAGEKIIVDTTEITYVRRAD
jgi:N-acetyl sugar amidotransferase